MRKLIKDRIKYEQNYKCGCCMKQLTLALLEIHHIQFRSKGGKDNDENLIALCHRCHIITHRIPNELTKWYYHLAKERVNKYNPYIGGLDYELHH